MLFGARLSAIITPMRASYTAITLVGQGYECDAVLELHHTGLLLVDFGSEKAPVIGCRVVCRSLLI